MRKKMAMALLAAAFCAASNMTAFAMPEEMPDGGVFDAEYYAENNPDVVAVMGSEKDALYLHYTQAGKNEGRLPGVAFDAEYYAANNPDVAAVLGSEEEVLYQHYRLCGKIEGRQPSAPGTELKPLKSSAQTTPATPSAPTTTEQPAPNQTKATTEVIIAPEQQSVQATVNLEYKKYKRDFASGEFVEDATYWKSLKFVTVKTEAAVPDSVGVLDGQSGKWVGIGVKKGQNFVYQFGAASTLKEAILPVHDLVAYTPGTALVEKAGDPYVYAYWDVNAKPYGWILAKEVLTDGKGSEFGYVVDLSGVKK